MTRALNGFWTSRRNRHDAESFAEEMRWTILDIQTQGYLGPTALANELNRLGHKTREGGKWHPMSVARVLKLLGLPSVKPKPGPQVGTDHAQVFEKLEQQVEAGMYDQIVIK
ncbi:MAG: hypothetical protein ABL962_10555 [Fimbriimonadaceae bacterium]